MTRLLLPFLCALPLAAQTEAAPASVLTRLPGDTASVLVVRDLMPHVDAVLGSAWLRDLLAATGDLQQEVFSMRLDAAALQKQVGLFRGFVPTEVTVAASAPATAALVQFLRGLGLGAVLASGGDGPDEPRAALRTAAATALGGVGEMALTAMVRLRDERMAERWFDSAVETLRALPADPGLVVTTADASVTVTLTPMQALGGRFGMLLKQAGITMPESWNPRLVATLTQRGGELSLQLGTPAAPPLAAAALGRLWRESPDQVLFARLAAGTLADDFAGDLEHLFALMAEDDTPPLLAQVVAAVSQLSELPQTASGSIDLGAAGATFVSEGDYGGDAEAMAEMFEAPPAEFARCVKPEEGPFVLNTMPLDLVLAATFDEIQTRSLRQGRELPAAVQPLADFLQGDASSVFQPGVLMTGRSGTFRSAKGLAKGAMPWAVGAVAARAEDADGARGFMKEIGVLVGDAFDLPAALWRDADLGLGVPTQTMNPDAVPWLREVDADLQPHWALVGDVLLLSSDVRLSKDLLARLRGGAEVALPPGRLVDWTMWRGDHLAAVVDGLGAWLRVLEPASATRMGPALTAVATLSAQVDAFEWITDLDGTVLRTRMELRLRRK